MEMGVGLVGGEIADVDVSCSWHLIGVHGNRSPAVRCSSWEKECMDEVLGVVLPPRRTWYMDSTQYIGSARSDDDECGFSNNQP